RAGRWARWRARLRRLHLPVTSRPSPRSRPQRLPPSASRPLPRLLRRAHLSPQSRRWLYLRSPTATRVLRHAGLGARSCGAVSINAGSDELAVLTALERMSLSAAVAGDGRTVILWRAGASLWCDGDEASPQQIGRAPLPQQGGRGIAPHMGPNRAKRSP